MQSITQISKLILVALAITFSILLLWQHDFIYTPTSDVSEMVDDMTIPDVPASTIVKAVPAVVANTTTTTITKQIITPAAKTTQTVTTTKSVTPTIWTQISKQFKIDHKPQSAAVKNEIRKLIANKQKLTQILQASAPYIYYIYTQTQARHLPAELALVPVIESEFSPYDKSNKGAGGLWQLMPQTARELGIKITSNYDGRRNVMDSTRAALAYFVDLGKMFKGNWYLALAAYNCGQVKVQSLIRRAGTRNYAELPLPRETKIYVPKLLAVAEIIHHPQQYGIRLPTVLSQPYFKTVPVNNSTTLTKYAEVSGINLKLLKKLNPEYRSEHVSVNKTLLVPVQQKIAV